MREEGTKGPPQSEGPWHRAHAQAPLAPASGRFHRLLGWFCQGKSWAVPVHRARPAPSPHAPRGWAGPFVLGRHVKAPRARSGGLQDA